MILRNNKKALLVLSDMIEETKRYNFISQALTQENRTAILKKETQDGRLPGLKDCDVVVVGAIDNKYVGGNGSEKFRELEAF